MHHEIHKSKHQQGLCMGKGQCARFINIFHLSSL